jgi:hypothetical protein
MRLILLAASLALAGLTGCATSSSEADKPAEARVYVTGSNIARRPDQPTSSPTYGVSADDMRKGMNQLPGTTPPPPCNRGDGAACGR